MPIRTRIALGAMAALTAAGAAVGAAAGGAQARAHAPGPLTYTLQPIALRFFGNSGPITGFPTGPLVPGDRIIGQGRILQGGVTAGRDNEACTVSLARDVLCQDIAIFAGRGDVQASWSFRWPATGTQGPASFDGIIDGGTGWFRAAHGSFHAHALPGGDLRITAAISTNG
jgi:hypothetical protein